MCTVHSFIKRNVCTTSKGSRRKISETDMGKVFLLLLLSVILEVAMGAIELPEHLKGPARILRKTCQAETNVSEELIEQSRNGVLVEDKLLQCYIHCLFRTVGLYDANGNILFNDVSHLLPTEIKEKLDDVSAKCQTVHGANKCETAWLTVRCFFDADPENSMLP